MTIGIMEHLLWLPGYMAHQCRCCSRPLHTTTVLPAMGTSLTLRAVTRGAGTYLSRSKVCQPHDAQLVHRMNLVVVRRIRESERQQALLLQVGFCREQTIRYARNNSLQG